MTSYCAPADITTYSVAPNALQGLTTPQLQAACDRASEEADELGFRARYALPLTAWGVGVTAHVADLAAWYALKFRGALPNPAANEAINLAANEARTWLIGVGKRIIHPNVTASSSSINQVPFVISQPHRGWSAAIGPGGGTTYQTVDGDAAAPADADGFGGL